MRRSLGVAFRSVLIGVGAPMALGACAMVGGGVPARTGPPPVAVDRPEPVAATAPSASVDVDEESDAERMTAQVVDVALTSIGTPYEWGGTDANGFDCSGLIRFAYAGVGIALPRTSSAQLRAGTPVEPEPALLRPGDILGFSGDEAGKAQHVGLFIGADEFIHSSSTGVRISTLRSSYWRERLVAARRPVG